MTRSASTSRVPPRRPNRRGEGSRLRDEIVRAATHLLQESGTEDAVTLRAVARKAGISAPSIYAHFANPAAINAAVVAVTFEALTAALRASGDGIEDPVQRLAAQCYGYLRFAREHPGLYRVLFTRSRAIELPVGSSTSDADHGIGTTSPDAVILEAGWEAFRLLVDAIASCVEAGRSTSQDAFVDATGLWSALHGYSVLRMAAPEFPWPDERTTVDAMIAGQARLQPPRPQAGHIDEEHEMTPAT